MAEAYCPNAPAACRRRSTRKDRHSKICTAKGPRDRRMRLSLDVARKFFDLQDLLGFDKASSTVQWLLATSKSAIKDLMTSASSEPPSEPELKVSTAAETSKRPSNRFKIGRESRAKARARARARTLEKKKKEMVLNESAPFDYHQQLAEVSDLFQEQWDQMSFSNNCYLDEKVFLSEHLLQTFCGRTIFDHFF